MKKNFLLLFTLLLLALVGTGCGDKVSGSLGKDGAELVGTWNGVGNALGRDDSYSCDYLSFSIDKEGTFTLKDIAQNRGRPNQKEVPLWFLLWYLRKTFLT